MNFKDWKEEKLKDPEFVKAMSEDFRVEVLKLYDAEEKIESITRELAEAKVARESYKESLDEERSRNDQFDWRVGECEHGLIGNYFTCNGGKNCERSRFMHCCYCMKADFKNKAELAEARAKLQTTAFCIHSVFNSDCISCLTHYCAVLKADNEGKEAELSAARKVVEAARDLAFNQLYGQQYIGLRDFLAEYDAVVAASGEGK